jgi:hypothetical protein
MRASRTPVDSPHLRRLRTQLDDWRRQPERGRSIPAPLWQAAVELAREHGCYRIALALGLSFSSLKERLSAAATGVQPSPRCSGFVEVVAPALGAVAPGVVVELEERGGRRMRIELRGGPPLELASVVREFWRGGR